MVSYLLSHTRIGLVAQWIRHQTADLGIAGSSPAKMGEAFELQFFPLYMVGQVNTLMLVLGMQVKRTKVLGPAVLEGLLATRHSLARSHYWPTQELLAAGFPPWPGPTLLRQPDHLSLRRGDHVDAGLSADAGST